MSGGPDGGGAFVTLYGRYFGGSTGTVEFDGAQLTVSDWESSAYRGMQKIVAQIPAGTPAKAGLVRMESADHRVSNELPLVTTERKILYASPDGTGDGSKLDTPTNLAGLKARVAPGDLIYLLEGTYDENTSPCADGDDCGWLIELSSTATSSNPIQIVGYPGARAEIKNHHDAIVVRQNYLRVANLALHAGVYAGAVLQDAVGVAFVGNEFWADQPTSAAIGSNGGNVSYELTGNFIHHVRTGSINFAPKCKRTIRYNQFEVIERVLELDLSLDEDVQDYANSAANIGLYAYLQGCGANSCATPETGAKASVFNNVINSARYFVYEYAPNSTTTSVSFMHNTVGDALCIAGSNDPSIAVDAQLRANILTPTRAATCTDDELATAGSVDFDGQTNHWGTTTVPPQDADGTTGALNLDSNSKPGATSTVCGLVSRSPSPLDVDYWGDARLNPTAFGALECE